MVIVIPEGLYHMEQKYAIIKVNAERYRKGTKKVKGQMLDELTKVLNMNRQYISYLLRNTGRKVVLRERGIVLIGQYSKRNLSRRGRKKLYTADIEKLLLKIWVMSGFISSKHLQAFIRLNWDIIYSQFKGEIDREKGERLRNISAATIDRLLRKHREKWELRKKRKGNPFSSNLKRSIQVESWLDRKEREKIIGEVEIDLVHHCGESGDGRFIYTLTATEITSGWTELMPLRNKAMIWTMNALREIREKFPVNIRKIHSDNGSEFINGYLFKFCRENGIEFRRSRPYKKNDAPYVESKNWSMVRQYTGWRRYDTEEEYQILKKLTKLISLRHNLFIPQMKIIEKQRINGQVKKKYQIDIPVNRVLRMNNVEQTMKENLINLKNRIDIVKLTKGIIYLREKLEKIYNVKRSKQKCLLELE
jgi:hypothetical protein